MYGKIFSTLFTGSMRGQTNNQLVFIYLIANCTSDGVCDFLPQVIADATGLPLDDVMESIKCLENPDLMSRTTQDEGRRLRLIDPERPWGWQIINHEHYRKEGDLAEYRNTERLRKQAYRAKKKGEDIPDVPCLSGQVPKDYVSVSASVSASEKGDCKEGKINWDWVKDEWNRLAKKNRFPTIARMTQDRKRKYKARTATAEDKKRFWEVLELELPRMSDFAHGETPDGTWVLSFDFVVHSEQNFTKVEERKYLDRKFLQPAKKKVPQGRRLDLMTREQAMSEEEGDA